MFNIVVKFFLLSFEVTKTVSFCSTKIEEAR